MEGTFVPILLQEFLLTLRLLRTSFLRTLQILLQSLLLWQRSSPLNFFPLELPLYLNLLVAFYSREFSKPPCFKFAFGI